MSGEFVIALHALIYLKHHKIVVSSDALAANICTNAARIRKVMSKLKKANLISTKGGVRGGYELNCELENVSLQDIASLLGEQLVNFNWHSGSTDIKCLIASGMSGVISGLEDDLNEYCKQKLSQISLANLEEKLNLKDKK